MAVECRLVALLVIEYLVVVSYLYVLLSQTLPLPSPNMVATGDGLDWWLLARLPRSACFGRPWLFTQARRLSYSHVLLLCCIIRYI
jgi:hypothetical protein